MGGLCYVTHRDRCNKAIASSGDIDKKPIAIHAHELRVGFGEVALNEAARWPLFAQNARYWPADQHLLLR